MGWLLSTLPWLCLAACGRLGFDSQTGAPPAADVDAATATMTGPTTVGLIAYWPMDSVGPITADVAGAHDATCTAGTCPTATAGIAGGAAMFDGASSCLVVDSLAAWADTSFTISAWIQAPAVSGPIVVHESDTSCPSPAMEVSNGAGLVQYNTVGAHSEAWTAAIASPAQWHHVAASWDGTKQQVFVDGVCACGIAPTDMPVLNPQTFSIGCYPAATTWFTGALDEVRIYDRVLATDEIAGLYAISGYSAPAPQPCSATCATTPP